MNVDPVQEWINLADQDEASARFLAGMHPMPLEATQAVRKELSALL